MINAILISNTDIVNKIFSLVTNKLAIELQITDSCNLDGSYDIIFVDEGFIDANMIQLKSISKKLILVSSFTPEIHDFEYIILKPFLPSKLQTEIESLIKNIPEDEPVVESKPHESIEEEHEEGIDDLVNFVDSMFDEVEEELESTEDESIILEQDLGHGGVLDKNELSKLFEMVNDDTNKETKIEDDSNDWIELADIIDKAIDDVATYEFEEDKPIKLILNQYSMDELNPLFQKLDQNIIDKLTQGKDISLQLRLEK